MGYEQKFDNMRKAKDKVRIESPCIGYPTEVPKLRKIIIIIDFDFLVSINVFKLFRSRHIDQYIVEENGERWVGKYGLSKILESIRKSMPRVLSSRAL
jgi:hypothetical protein